MIESREISRKEYMEQHAAEQEAKSILEVKKKVPIIF